MSDLNNNLNNLTTDHCGCWIDGSHSSSTGFDKSVAALALSLGWPADEADKSLLEIDENELDGNALSDYSQDLYDLSNNALEWMNSQLPEGSLYFWIYESQLRLDDAREDN